MNSPTCIRQTGIIEKIVDERALVRIDTSSACMNCHAKKACGVSESPVRIIEAEISGSSYSIGEQVFIIMKQSTGIKAVVLAYILPFILVITTVLVLVSLKLSELVSGIIALAVLVPYFGGLFLLRDQMKRSFIFTLQKTN